MMKVANIQKHGVAIVLFVVTLVFSVVVLTQSASWMGREFPGYLTFENQVVGAFYMPEWDGYQLGKTYHYITGDDPDHSLFQVEDYWGVVVLPVLSGLLFFLFGLGVYFFSPFIRSSRILLLLHFLIGNYLILSPDFHMNHHFTFVLLFVFSCIPATAMAFAHVFPEQGKKGPKWPWFVSLIFFSMHVVFFNHPNMWLWVERSLLVYVIFSFFYWIIHQIQFLSLPSGDFAKIMARYQLRGQIFAFAVPLVATLGIFLFDIPVPLNFMAPLILLFPVFFFVGLLLGKIRFDRLQFARFERRATIGNLMTGLSHELNNPLNFIYAAIDPLKDNVEKDKDKEGSLELIATMQEGANRMKTILEGFRMYAHPGTGQRNKEFLHEIILQTLQFISPQWNHIEVHTDFDDQDQLVCNKVELGQVCVNLLQNAVDSMKGKGKLSIQTTVSEDQIQWIIKDEGTGMSPQEMQRIFDPFYTTKDQGEGTGMGLSIVAEIINQHQGSIDVQSEVGKGSAFIITLPRTS